MERLPQLTEDEKTLRELEKAKKIKKEVTRLKGVFKNLDKNKLTAVLSLINRAAAMSVYLEELEATINRDGYKENYRNGANQHGIKQTVEIEIYNSMSRNFYTIIKQLSDLAPPAERKDSKLAALRNRRITKDV
jgi:hypothetical protein